MRAVAIQEMIRHNFIANLEIATDAVRSFQLRTNMFFVVSDYKTIPSLYLNEISHLASNIFILFIYKYINPLNDHKTYRVKFVIATKFISYLTGINIPCGNPHLMQTQATAAYSRWRANQKLLSWRCQDGFLLT